MPPDPTQEKDTYCPPEQQSRKEVPVDSWQPLSHFLGDHDGRRLIGAYLRFGAGFHVTAHKERQLFEQAGEVPFRSVGFE